MKKLGLLIILISSLYLTNAQQVIGSYPLMDGGFEDQTVGVLSVLGSIAANDVSLSWTNQGGSPANIAAINSTGGRSGSQYVTFSFSSVGAHRRLQSPTTTGILASTGYVIQFYYKSNGGTILDIRGAASQSGTGSPIYAAYDVNANVSTWTKFAKTITTSVTTVANGIGIVSVLPDAVGGFDIDDFVIYQGAIDNVAPDVVTNFGADQTANNGELEVLWDAPVTGVDGGGYLVVRRTGALPTGVPNQNGIYTIGNIIVDGEVVYIGTATNFLQTGLNPSNLYYYIIYTVDKAFNYSTGVSAAGGPLPVELTSFSATTIGSTVKLSWNTATEVNNYGFEIQKSVVGSQKSEWNAIGFVNGNGNSNSPKSYSYEDKNITAGKYSYRLKQIDNDGQFEYSKAIEVDFNAAKKFELSQNYPNPFNPATTIRFNLPEAGDVKITLYNLLGQQIRTLVNEFKESGVHTINFDASNLNSGMYIYKIEAGSFVQTRKMTLIK